MGYYNQKGWPSKLSLESLMKQRVLATESSKESALAVKNSQTTNYDNNATGLGCMIGQVMFLSGCCESYSA
jgi:hypothetical protein